MFYIFDARHKTYLYFLLTTVTILAIGIKWSTAFYVGLVWMFGILWFIIHNNWRLAKPLIILGFSSLLLGVFLFGYHPYVTNTIQAGHPLYPLMGSNHEDIMSMNTPGIFDGSNRFRNFIRSFSGFRTSTGLAEGNNIGGYGYFLFPLLILSFLTLYMNRKRVPNVVWYIVVLTLCSAFIFEQAWWARYIPQLWMIMPIALIAILRIQKSSITTKVIAGAICAMAAVTLPQCLVVLFSIHIPYTRMINKYTECNKGKTIQYVRVDTTGFYAPYIIRTLEEKGIDLRETTIDSIRTKKLITSNWRSPQSYYIYMLECNEQTETSLNKFISSSSKKMIFPGHKAIWDVEEVKHFK